MFELLETYLVILLHVDILNHQLDLTFRQSLTYFGHRLFQVPFCDEARVVDIEKRKSLPELFLVHIHFLS